MDLKKEIELATQNMKAVDKLVYVSGNLIREEINLKKNCKELNKILDEIVYNSSNGKNGMDEIEDAKMHIEIVQAYTQRVNDILALAKSYGIEADADNVGGGTQMRMSDYEE